MSLGKNKSAGLKICEDYIELIMMLHLFPKWNAIAMDKSGAEIGGKLARMNWIGC